jgi:hypothetical protein
MGGIEMSDTPRTDDQIGYDGSTMTLIRIEFAKQLERELNAANERIKRLEEAGDAMFPWSERVGQEFWTKAKEDKL